MHRSLSLPAQTFAPALFLAPMAGITNSAFRRLVADFGGYGALWTEMLSPGALLRENLSASPYTKKRPREGAVVYQLVMHGGEDISAVIGRIEACGPAALDINLGCPAPMIARTGAGGALFCDAGRLERTLAAVRNRWPGTLTVKCRLGEDRPGWERAFIERLEIFHRCGINALIVHPRFAGEKLKRRARWELFAWIAQNTPLPLIANGDILSRAIVETRQERFAPTTGIMIGRAAVARPWIFRLWSGNPPEIDFRDVWERHFRYTCEDFPPEKAIGRIKEFTAYYARNFFFGHELYRRVQGAAHLGELRSRALDFLSRRPRTTEPSFEGI